jgi:hypothetical protein
VGQQFPPYLCQDNRLSATLQQPGTQIFLKLHDAFADSLLRQIHLFCRPPKAQGLGHGSEVMELAQLHGGMLRQLSRV